MDSDTGAGMDSNVRTSSGTFFNRAEDEIIARIEERISLVTMLPLGTCKQRSCFGPPRRLRCPMAY